MLRSLLPSTFYNRIRLYNYFKKFIYDKHSYFVKTGFIQAYIKGIPCDSQGNPIPWMNYAVIHFFDRKLNKNIDVFEYGSGFSTLYFAKKVNFITSVEYDKDWYKQACEMTENLNNVSIIYNALESGYAETVNKTGKTFNMIVVDGRDRVKCAINSYAQLTEDGILILDDSDRMHYRKIWEFYIEKGFKELTFTGLKPTGFSIESTTIFYRSNNVLQI